MLNNINLNVKLNDSLIIYSYEKSCYRCKLNTKIYTYITYKDSPKESLNFPWNTHRILKRQNLEAHIRKPSLEFYSINVLGEVESLDKILKLHYQDHIKDKYSATTNLIYAMNLCEHCGAQQGYYFIYEDINKKIQSNQKINIEKIVKF